MSAHFLFENEPNLNNIHNLAVVFKSFWKPHSLHVLFRHTLCPVLHRPVGSLSHVLTRFVCIGDLRVFGYRVACLSFVRSAGQANRCTVLDKSKASPKQQEQDRVRRLTLYVCVLM